MLNLPVSWLQHSVTIGIFANNRLVKVVVHVVILTCVLVLCNLFGANRVLNALVVATGGTHLLARLEDSGLAEKVLGGGWGDLGVRDIAIVISLWGWHFRAS